MKQKINQNIVREYEEKDLEQLIQVYKSSFAEPPWNEYMKCSVCEVEYGLKEVETASENCKKCENKLKLVEYWSSDKIISDLNEQRNKTGSIVLVAENCEGVVGFTGGYKLFLENFSFLEGCVDGNISYMDEIAVRADKRLRGVGTLLGEEYFKMAFQKGIQKITLRTDERNTASMALFNKLGFEVMKNNVGRTIYDPEFSNRLYLIKELK